MQEQVIQWLEEIKSLHQQLAAAYQEREAARETEAQWRELYNKEAQQRRNEAKLAQEKIEALKLEIEKVKSVSIAQTPTSETPEILEKEIENLQTPAELKAKLIEVLQERDRLSQALITEQKNHAQTRTNLTTALGDTIEQLTKLKGTRHSPYIPDNAIIDEPVVTPGPESNIVPKKLPTPAKTSSLQLPPFIPERSPIETDF